MISLGDLPLTLADNHIMLSGLPGSGKSSICSHFPNHHRVSTDALRHRLYGSEEIQGYWPEIQEALVDEFRLATFRNQKVIYDATNLTKSNRSGIVQLFPGPWAVIEVDVPADIAWKRNLNRPRVVPYEPFWNMVRKHQKVTASEGFVQIIKLANECEKVPSC